MWMVAGSGPLSFHGRTAEEDEEERIKKENGEENPTRVGCWVLAAGRSDGGARRGVIHGGRHSSVSIQPRKEQSRAWLPYIRSGTRRKELITATIATPGHVCDLGICGLVACQPTTLCIHGLSPYSSPTEYAPHRPSASRLKCPGLEQGYTRHITILPVNSPLRSDHPLQPISSKISRSALEATQSATEIPDVMTQKDKPSSLSTPYNHGLSRRNLHFDVYLYSHLCFPFGYAVPTPYALSASPVSIPGRLESLPFPCHTTPV